MGIIVLHLIYLTFIKLKHNNTNSVTESALATFTIKTNIQFVYKLCHITSF